jgi:hypothetical protein
MPQPLYDAVKDPDLCDVLTPWKEWRLREASAKPPAGPSAQQPAITQTLAFDTNAYMGGIFLLKQDFVL